MGRSKRRSDSEESEGIAEWMLTYSDLVTLLLTFFIMLFSMATLDKQKFEEVANSLRSSFVQKSNGEAFNVNTGKDLVSITEQNNVTQQQQSEKNNDPMQEMKEQQEKAEKQKKEKQLKETKEKVEKAIEQYNLKEFVSLIEDKETLILRFNSPILFDSGSADIKESGKETLKKMGSLLKELANEIEVQGHTDNLPINTVIFPTNWELSTKRATNVGKFLIDACGLDPAKLTATGSGEFKPIASNDTAQGREKNRRIDIVIEK